jgi:hypothetical protein
MRTTLDLPESLLLEAMTLSKAPNKTQTIILALEELIQKSKIQELKSFKGKLNLEIDLNLMRGRS